MWVGGCENTHITDVEQISGKRKRISQINSILQFGIIKGCNFNAY